MSEEFLFPARILQLPSWLVFFVDLVGIALAKSWEYMVLCSYNLGFRSEAFRTGQLWSDVESGLVYLLKNLVFPTPSKKPALRHLGYFTSISAFQKSVFFFSCLLLGTMLMRGV